MLLGYTLILMAAVCWGCSAILAKHLNNLGEADALLLSQARVTFSWFVLLIFLLVRSPKLLQVRLGDIARFVLLGLFGVAGANYLLYYAIGRMNPAVADLIQFTAPLFVAVYMALRGLEPMDRPKAVALALSLAGAGLALGAFNAEWSAPLLPILSAAASALCYAFLLIFGKGLSRRYATWTFLHYALLTATVFWLCIRPPWVFAADLTEPKRLGILFFFALLSILAPYSLFFSGLKRVPASRAGIVSTFEPVVIAIGAAIFLGDRLSVMQWLGIALVLAAIILVELTSPKPTAEQAA